LVLPLLARGAFVRRKPQLLVIAASIGVFATVWPADARAQYPAPFGYPVRYDISSSVRLVAKPSDAEVYVDGYYAGIVDDFDGFFQRLYVPPGPHEFALYHDGYRSVHQKVYLTPRSSQKFRYTMVPLAAGEPNEPRPPIPLPPQHVPPPGTPWGPPPPSSTPDTSRSGALSIRVQPANAEIHVDGEVWRSTETVEHLVVQLSEGTHHVEVLKDGYQKFSADIHIRRGETTPLNVSLLTSKPH
jgi:PEGA domain